MSLNNFKTSKKAQLSIVVLITAFGTLVMMLRPKPMPELKIEEVDRPSGDHRSEGPGKRQA